MSQAERREWLEQLARLRSAEERRFGSRDMVDTLVEALDRFVKNGEQGDGTAFTLA